MAIEITIPRLGWSGEEATFASWLKKDGDKVKAGEALFELEGEKSLQEIESLDSGILRLLPNSPTTGAVVKVGQPIAYLAAEGEVISTLVAPAAASSSATAKNPSPVETVAAPVNSSNVPTRAVDGGVPSTPRARRVAAELSVDLADAIGSGKGGRVRERDVRALAEAAPSPMRGSETQEGQELPISATRRLIADRMMQSSAQTAPVTLTSQVDATNLVALRSQYKATGGGVTVPAYTDIIAKLAAATIAQFPEIIGQWQGNRIVQPRTINVGIAVDTEHGLMVPVITDVPRRTLTEVTHASRTLIEAAHARKLKADAVGGGVFTITNLGAFGIDMFTPIINLPESAILGLGAIRKVPSIVDGKNIAARDQMIVSLTFDHRVLDGAPAARFLQALVQAMENPMVWLLEEPRIAKGGKPR